MPKKVPNIQRIINNDILKIVNIVFSVGGGVELPPPPPPPRVCTSLGVPYLFFYLSNTRRFNSSMGIAREALQLNGLTKNLPMSVVNPLSCNVHFLFFYLSKGAVIIYGRGGGTKEKRVG